MACALALLAIPVWSLTRPSSPMPESTAPPSAPVAESANYRVVLTASAPARLRARAANHPEASTAGAARVLETRFSMSSDNPEDIAVFAGFEDRANPTALRVAVEKNGRPLMEKTFWGTGVVEDVVRIPAK